MEESLLSIKKMEKLIHSRFFEGKASPVESYETGVRSNNSTRASRISQKDGVLAHRHPAYQTIEMGVAIK